MKKAKPILITGIVFLAISIIFTILIKIGIDSQPYHANPLTKDGVTYEGCCGLPDVQCIQCPDDYLDGAISFSEFNFIINNVISPSYFLYKLTNYVGYLPILVAGVYCIVAIVQLIRRKSLKKVDKGFFALAGFLVILALTYILFEKLAINYRPFRIDGELEASYPSSHTLLTICLSFGIILFNRIAYSGKKPLKYLNAILTFLTAFIVAGRFLSGVHWATDIIGGLFIATSYVLIYHAILLKIYNKHDKIEKAKQGEK